MNTKNFKGFILFYVLMGVLSIKVHCSEIVERIIVYKSDTKEVISDLSTKGSEFIKEKKPLIKNNYIDKGVMDSSIFTKLIYKENKEYDLISHGRSGELLIKGKWLNAEEIAVFIASQIANSQQPSAIRQINIYGCEFAKGEKGLAAVLYLEKALGLKVNASTNITGKDGDWVLEFGNKEVKELENYKYNLQVCPTGPLVQGTADDEDFDGDGICNEVDIDDDNDGILDEDEMGSSFFAQASFTYDNFQGGLVVGNVVTTVNGDTWTDMTSVVDGSIFPGSNEFTALTADPVGTMYSYDVVFDSTKAEIYLAVANLDRTDMIITDENGNPVTITLLQGDPDTSVSGNKIFDSNLGTNSFGRSATGIFLIEGTFNTLQITHEKLLSGGDGFVISFAEQVFNFINTDGDANFNHQDLDSDGDGCSDSYEAGAILTETSDHQFVSVGGESTDSNSDGLADIVDADLNGLPDYTMLPYAYSDALNLCADTDNDGVSDLTDIDDDNDGILDAVESPNCFYTESEALALVSLTSDGVYPTTEQDELEALGSGSTTAGFNFTNGQDINGGSYFTMEFPTEVELSSIDVVMANTNSFLNSGSNTTTTNTQVILQGSLNGNRWIDLSSSIFYDRIATGSMESFTVTQNTGKYLYYRIVGDISVGTSDTYSSGTVNALRFNLASNYVASLNPKETCTDDADGDGSYNHQDLESDGDDCSDSYESGAILTETLDHQFVSVGGESTDSNSDGLADIVDADLNGLPDYTMLPYAYSGALNLCADTDNDGVGDLTDIDDDNDGILDAVESPNCFYTESEALTLVSLTSDGVYPTTEQDELEALGSGSTTAGFNFTNAQDINGGSYFTMEFPTEVELSSIDVVMANTNSFLNSSSNTTTTNTQVILQGSLNGSTWIDLSSSIFYDRIATGSMESFTVTQNTGKYLYYRIVGDASVGTSDTYSSGTVNALRFNLASNYVASLNPKETCTDDADGDGSYNHQDLDSDGDDCSDSYESGAILTETLDHQFVSVGGESTDSNSDGLADIVDADLNGLPDYTMLPYAYSDALNLCADTDNDGVGDLTDIDDDNDGILDAVESPNCFYTESEALTLVSLTSDGVYPTTEQDELEALGSGSTTAGFNFTNAQDINGGSYFTMEFPTEVELSSIDVVMANTNSFLNSSSNTTTTNTQVILQGSLNGSTWIDLSSSIFYDRIATGSMESFTVTQNTGKYLYYRIVGDISVGTSDTYSGGTVNALRFNLASNYVPSLNPKGTCTDDADGDGSYNHQDLDSDGDDCSDSYESGAILTETLDHQFVSVGGESTDSNSDGLADIVDADLNGLPDYTMLPYAYSDALSLCADTDNDGVGDLTDIDDDNDGILDAVESPNCFYTEAEAETIVAVTSTLTIESAANPLTNAHDGIDKSATNFTGLAASQTSAGASVYEITPATPIALQSIDFSMYNIAFTSSANVLKLQGFANGAWEDLDVASNRTVVNSTETFINSLHPNTIYSKFRITGEGASQIQQSRVYEIYLNANNYVASLNPKETCTDDADGDGSYNHQDLDSDGDDCSDSYESGAILTETLDHQFVSVGGESTDSNSDGLADIVDADLNGLPDYTMLPYAYSDALSLCADTDNDGVSDLTDIDDDNDGILDAVESPNCFYTESEALTLVSLTSDGVYPTTEQDELEALGSGSTTAGFNFTNAQDINGGSYFTMEFPTRVELSSIDVVMANTNSFLNSSSNTTTTNTQVILQGSLNGSTWIDLSSSIFYDRIATGSMESFTVTQNTGKYLYYRIVGDASVGTSDTYSGGTVNALRFNLASNYVPSLNPKGTCIGDADGDGSYNHQDLESDGDDCSDSYESGAILTETSDHQFVSVGGESTDSNSDGLADIVDADLNGLPDYTMLPYAYSDALSLCTDTDNDGISDLIDLDDDNDGILDSLEYPCLSFDYYSPDNSTHNSTTANIFGSPRELSNSHDGSLSSFSGTNAGAGVNVIDGTITYGYTNVLNDVTELQIYNNAGSNLVDFGTIETIANITIFGENNAILYSQDNVSIPNGAAGNPYTINVGNLQGVKGFSFTDLKAPSGGLELVWRDVKLGGISCSLFDTDLDGIPNHLDLDSDGDGCPDTKESDVLSATGNPVLEAGDVINGDGTTNTTISTEDALVAAPYGANGFADTLETSEDGIFTGTYTYSNALDALVSNCFCLIDGATGVGATSDVGMSTLERLKVLDPVSNWPHNIANGHLVLESKDKGLVLTRIANPETAITNPIEGMMVYDMDDRCLKLYDGTTWGCIEQTCPD